MPPSQFAWWLDGSNESFERINEATLEASVRNREVNGKTPVRVPHLLPIV
jgi:hypothetical protein